MPPRRRNHRSRPISFAQRTAALRDRRNRLTGLRGIQRFRAGAVARGVGRELSRFTRI